MACQHNSERVPNSAPSSHACLPALRCLQRLKELLNRVAGQGWGTPEALGLQQHGAAHLRKAAAGLEAYLATLAGGGWGGGGGGGV